MKIYSVFGALLWESRHETMRRTVEAASDAKTDLSGADLSGADLSGAVLRGAVLSDAVLSDADLRGAVLSDADLSGADLSGADLSGADLSGAVLRGAVLSDAVLSDADLRGAVLSDADLSGADLSGADLSGAVLRDAVLSGAVLTPIRDDLWAVLDAAPNETPALLAALTEGRIDGSAYEGDCACLVGTIANARGCNYAALGPLKPDASRPAERWFTAISPGNKPSNHAVAKITEGWIREWMTAHPTKGVQP